MACPKCGSENIQVVSTNKGFGISNGIIGCLGAIIFLPLAICGLCGVGKSKTIRVCANCGHKMK